MRSALAGSLLFLSTVGGLAGQDKGALPFWKRFEAHISGTVGEFKVGGYSGESAEIDLTTEDGKVTIGKLRVTSGQNDLELTGGFGLPEAGEQFDLTRADFAMAVDARDVKAFVAQRTTQPMRGDLSVRGTISQKEGWIQGSLEISGTDVHFGGLDLSGIAGTIDIERSVVHVRRLTAALPDGGSLNASGTYALNAPFAYAGAVHADVKDLAPFAALAAQFGQAWDFGGALKLDWTGDGQRQPASHTGEGAVTLRGGRFDRLAGVDADVACSYSPLGIELPKVRLQTGPTEIRTGLALSDKQLRVSHFEIRQRGALVATGTAHVPLDLTRSGPLAEWVPADGAIAVDLISQNFDVARLPGAEGLGLRGALTANLHMEGTPSSIRGRLEARGRDLHAGFMGRASPASADLSVSLSEERLTAAGAFRPPELQPVTIAGTFPFHLPTILRERRINPDSPVRGSFHLPTSSLGFLSKWLPSLRNVRGNVTARVEVDGTIRSPLLSGSIQADLARLQLNNAAVPDLREGRIDLRLSGRTLTVNQFNAKLAGGPLAITGTVAFSDPMNPMLDLGLRGESVLLLRNDNVTARADLALSLTGPLATAHLAGSAHLVESGFFREIDILPLELPGRAAPALPRPAARTLSIPHPPFSNWTFDVSIQTRDPFGIGSNLAAGAVLADLALAGTGLVPTLEGQAEATNLTVSLPFSRLRIDRGLLRFLPGAPPLNPQLDIHGMSRVRDYDIDIHFTGTAFNPETQFISRPPLAHEDILSLLATGVTRDELSGNVDVVAGRATWLFLQRMHRQVFRKQPGGGDVAFLDRMGVELGGIDPQTGEHSILTRFQIFPSWEIVGIANAGGGVQGRIRYVVRFR
jgi:hypothetical protein